MTRITIPYSLLERGWPYRTAKGMEWESGSGARTIADGRYGLPVPKDRVILLELATEARSQGRVIRRKPGDIAERYGLNWKRSHIIKAVHRVGYSWYEPPTSETCCRGRCQSTPERLAVASNVALCETSGELVVRLAEPFFRDAVEGAPGELRVVRELLSRDQLGALDIYLITAWKDFRGEHGRVPILVNGRIFGIFCAAEDRSRARQQIYQRWVILSQFDPDNAFEIVSGKKGGPFLVYRSEAANHELEGSTAPAGAVEKSGTSTTDVPGWQRAAGAGMSAEQWQALRKSPPTKSKPGAS